MPFSHISLSSRDTVTLSSLWYKLNTYKHSDHLHRQESFCLFVFFPDCNSVRELSLNESFEISSNFVKLFSLSVSPLSARQQLHRQMGEEGGGWPYFTLREKSKKFSSHNSEIRAEQSCTERRRTTSKIVSKYKIFFNIKTSHRHWKKLFLAQ